MGLLHLNDESKKKKPHTDKCIALRPLCVNFSEKNFSFNYLKDEQLR
jgi:hypothetical protein